jgi:hypothetical protein
MKMMTAHTAPQGDNFSPSLQNIIQSDAAAM